MATEIHFCGYWVVVKDCVRAWHSETRYSYGVYHATEIITFKRLHSRHVALSNDCANDHLEELTLLGFSTCQGWRWLIAIFLRSFDITDWHNIKQRLYHWRSLEFIFCIQDTRRHRCNTLLTCYLRGQDYETSSHAVTPCQCIVIGHTCFFNDCFSKQARTSIQHGS